MRLLIKISSGHYIPPTQTYPLITPHPIYKHTFQPIHSGGGYNGECALVFGLGSTSTSKLISFLHISYVLSRPLATLKIIVH